MFDNILLEPEPKELLIVLVEAARNVPRDARQKFMFIAVMGGAFVQHAGFKNRTHQAYKGDIESLGSIGLLALSYSSKGTLLFDITALGFKYYEYLKQQLGQPIQQLETSMRSFLDADTFQQKHPIAYQKWSEAEKLLWSSDSPQQLTMIGHLCREAVQEFATSLIEQYQVSNAPTNKASTVARMKALLAFHSEGLGTTVKPMLDALLAYWGTVNDIIQRQEHGGQKEGEPLLWEDGRRVVFNTAIVMFEIDRTLP